MAMWLTIFAVVILLCLIAVIFLTRRVAGLTVMNKLSQNHRGRGYLYAVLLLAAVTVVCTLLWGLVNAILVVIYLAAFWALSVLILHRFLGRDTIGYLAVSITIVFLVIGYFLAHHVTETDYAVTTDKAVEKLRIVQIADVHVSALMDGNDFAKAMDRIQDTQPDLLLITGDLVDSGTGEEDLKACCEALGRVKTTYGTYYVFGNHDKSYGATELNQMDGSALIDLLTQNGVRVLQDEAVPIGDGYYLLGRNDASEGQRFGNPRADIGELMEEFDPNRFVICMDHQPNDYDAEAAAGVDLVLSGHTHGGQMIPATHVGEWIGANDRTYGYEERGNSKFIVTSGLSDWEIQFKTGCKAEYVVITVENPTDT